MKVFELFIWLVFAALTASMLTMFVYDRVAYVEPVAVQTTQYYFTTGDAPGFDLEDDKLRLGQVAGSARNSRAIYLQHGTARYAIAHVQGPGSDHISVDSRQKDLVNGSVFFMFTVTGSPALTEDTYEGDVILSFYE